MPPHSLYVEPFFGSGQVFWNKRLAHESIIIDRVPGILAEAGAVTGVRAIYGDAMRILPQFAPLLAASALIYCDPPYVIETRRGRRYYEFEMSDSDHVRLLTFLKSLACYVMISGYQSHLYQSQLQSWRLVEYRTRTRGRTVTESLWCNFPESSSSQLHDWRYAGRSYRERLAFKRLAARWLSRLQAMPARKRGYVLDAITEKYVFRKLDYPHRPGPSALNGAAISPAAAIAGGPRS